MIGQPVLLENQIQDYPWGSKSAIQNLTGCEPGEKPWAELWMGAHPKAPSKVLTENRKEALNDLISQFPEEMLGKIAAEKFNRTLPFLFKVLAAEKPLSIQAHPGKQMAKEGFDRENQAGIPIDAPHRNYRDNWPKPEIICAVEPFTALNGFRPSEEIADLFDLFCPAGLADQIRILRKNSGAPGITKMFHSLMEMDTNKKRRVTETAVKSALRQKMPEADWVNRLSMHYPDDIGILCPLYLNLIILKPFEAIFLGPGRMHAYLEGVGIELMANSDNVLRGGLTGKHIDIDELMRVVSFEPEAIDILRPGEKKGCEQFFPTKADEFRLSLIQTENDKTCKFEADHGLEILLCVKGGPASIYCKDTQLEVKKGRSFLVPASAGQYVITGDALFFKASVPDTL